MSSELHLPGQQPQNPLVVLANVFEKLVPPLQEIAKNTRQEEHHVYVMTRTLQGWGSYCWACSEAAGDYVWPCSKPMREGEVPPQFIKLAEPPTEPTGL
jgi:hypothetical protein